MTAFKCESSGCKYLLGWYILCAVTPTDANRPKSREDILLALQDAHTVMNVSEVRPAAAIHVNAGPPAKGSAVAVRDQAKSAQYENSDPLSYTFVQQRLSAGLAN